MPAGSKTQLLLTVTTSTCQTPPAGLETAPHLCGVVAEPSAPERPQGRGKASTAAAGNDVDYEPEASTSSDSDTVDSDGSDAEASLSEDDVAEDCKGKAKGKAPAKARHALNGCFASGQLPGRGENGGHVSPCSDHTCR